MTWKEIWEARRFDPSLPTLAALMAADGFDAGFGQISEAAWCAFVSRVARRLSLGPGSSLFEVGCGAGAFLYDFERRGCTVGGLDASRTLTTYAKQAMPRARIDCAEAVALDGEPCDAVVSCGVFMYFPSLDYAREVLSRMVAKAVHAVAVLDVPDLVRQSESLSARKAALGEAAYDARYRGLAHLYYDRAWFEYELRRLGLDPVIVEDQTIDGYSNGAFRFNVFGFHKPK